MGPTHQVMDSIRKPSHKPLGHLIYDPSPPLATGRHYCISLTLWLLLVQAPSDGDRESWQRASEQANKVGPNLKTRETQQA